MHEWVFQRGLKQHESEGRVLFEVFEKLTSACSIQISRETILIRINNIHENIWNHCGFKLRLFLVCHWCHRGHVGTLGARGFQVFKGLEIPCWRKTNKRISLPVIVFGACFPPAWSMSCKSQEIDCKPSIANRPLTLHFPALLYHIILKNTCMQKPSPTKPLYFPNVKYLK
jgi:hypothetical protein